MIKYQLPGYGETDSVLLTTTEAWTGRASAILVVEDTVFATLTGTISLHGTSALADATFPAGVLLRGHFTAITLTSGVVLIGLDAAGKTVGVYPTVAGAVRLVAPK